MVIVAAEGLGWSSRGAAGQRAAAGWRGWAEAAGKLRGRGRRWVLQRGCRGKGVLWYRVKVRVRVRVRVRVEVRRSLGVGLGLGLGLGLGNCMFFNQDEAA